MVCARIQCGCQGLEMTASLTLDIRLNPKSFQSVEIDSISLDNRVDYLKTEASQATNVPKHCLVLIFRGKCLKDEATLRSSGLRTGCVVHVLKKKEYKPPVSPRIMTEAEIQEIVVAFKTFNRHPSYRSALNRLIRRDIVKNIMVATPGLKEDPVAMSYLKNVELLLQMENVEVVKRTVKSHPCLADAVSQLAAAVHEEAAKGSSSANPGPSTSRSAYAADSLSDDEDREDSSQSSDSLPRGDSLSRQQSFSTITTSQLAAALASATGFYPISPRASSSNLSGTSSSSSGNITSEMFDLAMQQAIANAAPGSSSDTSNNSEITSEVGAISRRLSRQLVQMRELGLTDTAANLQALHATGGDVQAAIDLVFSGAMSSDTP